RVNRFLGWRAVGRLALRQAPLRRQQKSTAIPGTASTARVAEGGPEIGGDALKAALARLRGGIMRARHQQWNGSIALFDLVHRSDWRLCPSLLPLAHRRANATLLLQDS